MTSLGLAGHKRDQLDGVETDEHGGDRPELTWNRSESVSVRASAAVAHFWTIRSRSHAFVGVQIAPLISRNGSSAFAIIRVGRVCKQGVVGSSPIVSTKNTL